MAEFPIPSFLENQSLDEIHDRMIKELPQDIDKSEGGHPWNLTRPTAYAAAYFAEFVVPEAIKIIFPRFSENYADIMDYHGEVRGITRKSATHATGEITITGTEGTEIPEGSAFSTASINGEPAVEFVTTSARTIGKSGTVTAKIQAVEAGTIGNVPAGTIILKANNISGISNITNTEDTTGGTEQETTESLQSRIMDYDKSQGSSFVGSEADYKRWALEVDGTGSAVIIPAQDSTGLVTIILTDAAGNPANEDLLKAVYDHIIRPDAPSDRLAPINGGNLLVVAPEDVAIEISVTIETDGIVPIETIKESLLTSLKDYLIEATQDGEVRCTKVCSIISKTKGVEDYKDFLLNGGTVNVAISKYQLPTIDEKNLIVTAGTV